MSQIARLGLIATVTLALASSTSPATVRAQQARVEPWELLGNSLEGIYGGPNVMFQLTAAAVTPPLAFAVDGPVQRFFRRRDPLGDDFGTGAFVVGGTVPAALPVALYLGAMAAGDSELATAGSALIQAELIQLAVVGSLKWLTDRKAPYHKRDPNADSDDPTDFNFNPFDLHGGLRWPSGHTSSSVALVSCLVAFYPDQPWLAVVGYPAALAVGVGMIEGDYHWLSDIVAGALIGHVIGWVVGRQFRAEFDARNGREPRAQPAALQLSLLPGPGGLRLIGAF